MMKILINRRWLLVVFIGLISFTLGCRSKSVTALPLPIQKAHSAWANVLLITWFEKTSVDTLAYDNVVLDYTGKFAHLHTTVLSERLTKMGQLTTAQQEEIRITLESITKESAVLPLDGSQFITLGFIWQGQNYILPFSSDNCSDKLLHLLGIFDTAWGYTKDDSEALQRLCTSSRSQTTTTTTTLTELPKVIYNKYTHPHLFCITWFQEPFDGSYHKIALFTQGLLYYEEVTQNDEIPTSTKGWLTNTEQFKIQTILAEIRGSTPKETPLATTIITVSFPWEADYHLLTFDATSCPDELQQLLEISEDILERAAPGWEGFNNPCQKK